MKDINELDPVHGNERHDESFALQSALEGVGTDTRAAINDLFIQNAEQDFELGLELLEFDDGQYEVFADDSNIASSTGVTLNLGSPLNNAGWVRISSGGVSTERAEFTDQLGSIKSVYVDGNFGYSGATTDGTVRKWDVDTMTGTGAVFTGHTSFANSVYVDGDFGYSGSDDRTVKKWDVDTLTEQAEFTGHGDNVTAVYVDGNFGYSGGGFDDKTVKKWDVDTLTEQAEFTGHTGGVNSVYVDGNFGYSGGNFEDERVKKWDVDTLTEQAEFTGHTGGVSSVHVDGNFGYSGSEDSTVKKLDVDTLTEQAEFTGHGNSVLSVYVEGDFGYSGSFDETVKKWDVDTLTEQAEFTGHGDRVTSVYVDGNFGYSGSFDGTVKKWQTTPPQTNGTVQHTFQDLGFVPEEAVINDELRQPLPANADVYYKIEDADGNSQTIQRSNIDSAVDLTGFTSSSVSTTAIIERDDATVDTPQLDSWALYLTGA